MGLAGLCSRPEPGPAGAGAGPCNRCRHRMPRRSRGQCCDGGIKGRTYCDVVSAFLLINWVGMYIKLETRLTHKLHRLEHFNQIADLFRTIGPSSVLCRSGSHTFVATLCLLLLRCCLFYFRLIYNERFVTKSFRSSWSNDAGVLKRMSVSAC